MIAGTSLQLAATVLDAKGQPMAAAPVVFGTVHPTIAVVSATGLVASVGPVGTATITATAGTLVGSVPVRVVPAAAAALKKVSLELTQVAAGTGFPDPVQVVVEDAFGNPRPATPVTFAVVAGGGTVSVATVQTDARGRAATLFTTGSTAGLNTLTATVDKLPSVAYSVTTFVPGTQPSITSIAPSLLTPGISATLNGTGFGATVAENRVLVDGVAAPVLTASATQLTVTIPATLPCAVTHRAVIVVTVGGVTGRGTQEMRVGVQRAMPVGSAVVVTSPVELACTELTDNGAQYVVSVFSNATVPTAITPFRLEGRGPTPGLAGAVAAPTLRESAAIPSAARVGSDVIALRPGADAAHLTLLNQNRALLSTLRSRVSVRRSVGVASADPLLSPPRMAVAVGDTRTFRISKLSATPPGTSICAAYDEVTAKAVFVGAHSIIYEDVTATLAGQMTPYFERLGQEFEATMYRSDSLNFGDPLAYNFATNGGARVMMVFSPAVNRMESLAGFVLSCDLFKRNTTFNTVSNDGEIFYARVPTSIAAGFTGDTPDRWLWEMRSTVVHEVKHIASFSARLANNADDWEESWLEEGTALHAEELWLRDAIYRVPWKGNARYAATLYCDIPRPGCSGKPLGMVRHFDHLYGFLDAAGSFSPFGRARDGDYSFYGSAWSLVRWAIDRHGSSDQAFLRGLTQSLTSGTANLTARTGRPLDEMLGNWSLSLHLARHPAFSANPDVQFPTWDVADIFANMSSDLRGYPKPAPLVPAALALGNFNVVNSGIHGGSFRMYEITGVPAGAQSLSLLASAGGTAPPSLRMAIARVR
ncbi:MAG: hypothetical protein NVS1B4_11530 [Gemmatimonadaceae bacterium]